MRTMFPLTLIISAVSLANSLMGQEEVYHPTSVQTPVYFDVSPPLRDMQLIPPSKKKGDILEVPNKMGRREYFNIPFPPFTLPEDPVWQKENGSVLPADPSPIQNFDGITNISVVLPPDPQGEIGPDHYVQVVNSNFAVYSKTGTVLFGPAFLNTIWNGIPAPWNGTNDGDPIVLYDQAADRWLISQFSLPNSTQYAELVAVSQTGDPSGSWYRYVYQFYGEMPDYPKFGVWPDGYYMSANLFTGGATWGGVNASALERDKMLAGDPTALAISFNLGPSADPESMLPSDWDGAMAPPAGAPNYFTYLAYNALKVYEFHTDWVTPANSTFSFVSSLATEPFDPVLCTAPGGLCIPQPGTSKKLDGLTDRAMYRQQYRNFAAYQTLLNNHTVDVDGTGHAGIRWYELRNTGPGWTVYQQGTYAPDASHRWMGSMAMNAGGDISLGYSVSDATSTYPGIRFTGRRSSDPPGTMTITEQTIMNGSGSQTHSGGRWGDYSGMSVDPSDDNTFWYTTEYIPTTGLATWKTRIACFVINNAPSVTTLPATSVTTSSATLNGSINPNGLPTTCFFEWGPTSYTNNTTPPASAGFGTSVVPVSAGITGLSSGHTYHYRLKGSNADGIAYGANQIFTTLCATFSVPFSEGFVNNTMPVCWSQVDHQGNGQIWQFGTITTQIPNPALPGNYTFLNSDGYGWGNTQNADLISPTFNLSAYSYVYLSFQHYFKAWGAESGTVSYSIDNGSTWSPIAMFTSTSLLNPSFVLYDITAAAGQSQVRFKWNYTGNYGYSWAFDNVQVSGVPTNQSVTNVNVGPGVTSCYNAGLTLTVAGNGTTFWVQNGGSATLVAGQSILMLHGTRVYPGGYLRGHIAPTGPFCANPTMAPCIPVNFLNRDEGIFISETSLFTVYPNPTPGTFTLELTPDASSSQALVSIYAITGELVLTETLPTGGGSGLKTEFTLEGRPSGIYIIRVISGKNSEAAKIVRQ